MKKRKKVIPVANDPKLFKKFVKLMKKGIDRGTVEYGKYSYIKLDMIDMAIQEVRDLANYAYFLYIKLTLLKEKILKEIPEVTGEKK
ncbi:MAG: hypothetical protein ACTSYR_02085 [Candidatus Odinarchaeia archaeon]